MTAEEYYSKWRRRYKTLRGHEWRHLKLYGEDCSCQLIETALRSGIQCRILKTGDDPSKIEQVANANLIIECLKSKGYIE